MVDLKELIKMYRKFLIFSKLIFTFKDKMKELIKIVEDF